MNRPPKFAEFRIFRRGICDISPCGDGFCLSKIRGRIMIRPYEVINGVVASAAPKNELAPGSARWASCYWYLSSRIMDGTGCADGFANISKL